MSEEKQRALEEALNKLAKERTKSGWNWKTFKRKNIEKNPLIAISIGMVEKGVSLGFDAGLKQAEREIDVVAKEWLTGRFSWSTVLKSRLLALQAVKEK